MTTTRKRPTISDLTALKGERRLTMLRILTLQEAEAAECAMIDIVSIPPSLMLDPQYRDAAPSLFSMPGDTITAVGTADDFLNWAFRLHKARAAGVECGASFATVKTIADEAIPMIGDVGLIPSGATWTGGFKAVGKTADSAIEIFKAVKHYEAAGAFAAENEVVPVEIGIMISQTTSPFLLSMDAGAGCDAQYLFAEDVLDENHGHIPRYSKAYRNFAAEYDRLQFERVTAFSEFVSDANSHTYPAELRHFMKHVEHL